MYSRNIGQGWQWQATGLDQLAIANPKGLKKPLGTEGRLPYAVRTAVVRLTNIWCSEVEHQAYYYKRLLNKEQAPSEMLLALMKSSRAFASGWTLEEAVSLFAAGSLVWALNIRGQDRIVHCALDPKDDAYKSLEGSVVWIEDAVALEPASLRTCSEQEAAAWLRYQKRVGMAPITPQFGVEWVNHEPTKP